MVAVLKELFVAVTGEAPVSVRKLTGDASNRAYYRLTSENHSLIGVIGTSIEENRAFLSVAKAFFECGLNVPRVLAVSDDERCYVQDDLGDDTVFTKLRESREKGSFGRDDVDMLCSVMRALPDIQFMVPERLDFSVCYPVSDFDRRAVMWDLNYFKYCFLKGLDVEFDESALEDEFELLADMLLAECGDTFLYRDFQSRNVMWFNEKPYFIDFQGGRRGPIYYDVASFVGQARAMYTKEVVEMMIDAYMESLKRYKKVNVEQFRERLHLFRIFRLLQNLGAYGLRGILERKKKFVECIPAALEQLGELLAGMDKLVPALCDVIKRVAALERFVKRDKGQLVLDVFSFSYHRGIPDDYSGNGGGFVFDCRAIHNPGRYEPYKKLNGMDEEVMRFLEEKSDVAAFLDNVYSLVDKMVEEYLERGFSHIQLCFGCTGGQHRSVYCAEHAASHVAHKYGIRINVNHIMQNVKYTING